MKEKSCSAMEVKESQQMRMPERTETEVKTEIEVEEEFCALVENINTEETTIVDIKPAILPGIKSEVESSEKSSEFPEIISQMSNDISLLLRCRLCAIPSNNMIDIFSYDEADENMAERIERCVRIVVKETDTLPKQACQTCLEELELCFQFQQTVAEAEKQLLSLERQISGKLEETERNFQTSKLYDEECATDHDNIERTSKTVSEIEDNNDESTTIAEGEQTTDTTVNSSLALASLKPCSVVLVPIVSPCRNNRNIDGRRTSDDDERRNIDSFTEDLDIEKTSVSRIDLPSTCESEGPGETRISPQASPEKILSPHCEKGFKDEDNQTIHNGVQTNKPRYHCNLCAKTFMLRSSLTRHKKVHTGEGLHNCEYCEKKYRRKVDRDRHHIIHTSKAPFKCSMCEEVFSNTAGLKEHAVVHSKERSYPCFLSDKSFVSREVMRHVSTHVGEKTWQWDYSKKNYAQTKVPSVHSISSNQQPAISSNPVIYRCKMCGYEFKSMSSLTRHKRLHISKKLFSCEYCGKTFPFERYKDDHQLMHTGERIYKCSICEKGFLRMNALKRHAIVHSEAKDYSCSLCDKAFKTVGRVNAHMIVHTNERPWQCDYCKGCYKTKYAMTLHLRDCRDRPDAREPCHKCEVCLKEFMTKYVLNRHKKLHTSDGAKMKMVKCHSCKYCEKKFVNVTYRDSHQRTHTGERPFKCSICEAAFVDASRLKQHERVHSEGKNFNCDVCNILFKTLRSKSNHMLIHTSKERWECDYCKCTFGRKEGLPHHMTYCRERQRTK